MFVDFDGTITDVDTFDALVRHYAGDAAWEALDAGLIAGTLTLREALVRQARLVRASRDEAFAFLAQAATVDPAFAPFVTHAHQRGAIVTVVSSGLRVVIENALARAGVPVLPIVANEVTFDPGGWVMTFGDAVENGTDKAGRVRAAKARGEATVFVGDGISDFAAALEADRVFTKRNRALERYGSERGFAWTAFSSFAEIDRELFAVSSSS